MSETTDALDAILKRLVSEGYDVDYAEDVPVTIQVTVPLGAEDVEAHAVKITQSALEALEGDGRFGVRPMPILREQRIISFELLPLPRILIQLDYPRSRFPFSSGEVDVVVFPLQTEKPGKWAPRIAVPADQQDNKQHQAYLIEVSFAALAGIRVEQTLRTLHEGWTTAPETVAVRLGQN